MSLRPLTADEGRILRLLLTPDAEDQATFLGQLPFADVSGNWVEGLPSIDIQLAEGAPKRVTKEGPLPVEAEIRAWTARSRGSFCCG